MFIVTEYAALKCMTNNQTKVQRLSTFRSSTTIPIASNNTSGEHNKDRDKGVPALRGYFGPLWSQKLKIVFHQFPLIGILEEYLKSKMSAFL